ncbi:aldo/keto reductase [Acetobacter oeni]|uniref:Aldo/keto reductase n=1 Tax=Acetobacter oeni TaxID=304077 RepID=A0A511XN94_9PROT|nr:aldo/keto reductase [Acetobacter oeni]MBB3884267.1 aryl-alcohol dehydrogenase-like predicted oxidoreductase [Acetobacter oeni]NHO20214.1 aldo/keto reductase [Acetobacter oeni]GBR06313.1 oxidoreductase [Acetobacter oeni LMG 21952]GEN64414.1 aldo/keto reductase [Acetobacter oeni]
MQYRQLGRSGLRISAFTLGTMTFGGTGDFAKTGNTDLAGAKHLIDLCIDAGINMFDTADIYSTGASEEILGQAIKGRPDEIMVTTKARFRMGSGQNDAGLSRYHLIAACEASLRRLGRDHIDLYYLHEWDGLTPLDETLEALDTLCRAGKIRYAGVSNFTGWQLMKTLSVAGRDRYIAPVSQQIYYSLQAREAEYELLPAAVDQGLGVQVWSPLAGGLLSGKYRRGKPSPNGRQLENWGEPPVYDKEHLFDVVDVLVSIAEHRGVPAADVALAWTVARPGITSLVIGARNEEQLKANLKAIDLILTPEETKKLDDVSRPPLIYPYWHQARNASDRLSSADRVLIPE